MNHIPFLYINVSVLCCFLLMFVTILAVKKTPEIWAFLAVLVDVILWAGGSVLMRLQFWPGMRFWYAVSLVALFIMELLFYIFIHVFTRRKGKLLLSVFVLWNAAIIPGTISGFFLEMPRPVSLENGTSADDEVIIADNASEDGSMEWLAENYPGLRTIRFDRNYGFTGGYNRALAQIDAQYYLLINSDIEVTDGWLAPLEEYIDTHPLCGACAPKLHSWKQRDMFEYAGAAGGYLDKYGYPFCRGRVLDWTEKDFGQSGLHRIPYRRRHAPERFAMEAEPQLPQQPPDAQQLPCQDICTQLLQRQLHRARRCFGGRG